MTGGALIGVPPVNRLLAQIDNNMPELYRMLGVLQQSVEDIRSMLTEKKAKDDAIEKRVGSLERSRVRAKAWIAGASATLTVFLYVLWHLYEVIKELSTR